MRANRLKPYIDPNEWPLSPPSKEVDDPCLNETKLPADSFDRPTPPHPTIVDSPPSKRANR